MNKRFLLAIILISVVSSSVSIIVYDWIKSAHQTSGYTSIERRQKEVLTSVNMDSRFPKTEGNYFTKAAVRVRNSVVYVKTTFKKTPGILKKYHRGMEDFDEFLDDRMNGNLIPKETSGSGVILTDDGYIATNFHVIEDASEIEVLLFDKRSFKAKVIGTDPTTDLALLKIEAENLPLIAYGNSDNVSVGEWVLAVGNPFDLTSTVTAGIISAKSRSINILRERENMAVESFIQTDAAVNPGNSGGALVNLQGELIGINTAIASNTGSYSGYSFAVPVDLVKKVMDDLLKYGEVQRAMLGVSISEVTAELVKEKGLENLNGVYIQGVSKNGAADGAKLEEGDVILKIDNREVNSVAELQEVVARYRPGNKVSVTYVRDGKENTHEVLLKSKSGEISVAKREALPKLYIKELGAELQALSKSEKERFELAFGVKVVNVGNGKLADAGVPENFILTHVDKKMVKTPDETFKILKSAKGGVLLEGLEPETRTKRYFAIGF